MESSEVDVVEEAGDVEDKRDKSSREDPEGTTQVVKKIECDFLTRRWSSTGSFGSFIGLLG